MPVNQNVYYNDCFLNPKSNVLIWFLVFDYGDDAHDDVVYDNDNDDVD
jgi:hypothetical protein